MELNELPPKDGAQRAYCCACGGPLDLLFVRFHDLVSGVEIDMNDVPQLECSACGLRTLPDRTRFFIMHAHEIATKEGSPAFKSNRKKIVKDFGFTDVPFQRSEEHTSELQSLMRISYAVFCLKKKQNK